MRHGGKEDRATGAWWKDPRCIAGSAIVLFVALAWFSGSDLYVDLFGTDAEKERLAQERILESIEKDARDGDPGSAELLRHLRSSW